MQVFLTASTIFLHTLLKVLDRMTGLKLYTYPNNKNAWKALIAAEYVGAKIEVPAFEMGKTNKTPEFLKLNPNGKVREKLLNNCSPCSVMTWGRSEVVSFDQRA